MRLEQNEAFARKIEKKERESPRVVTLDPPEGSISLSLYFCLEDVMNKRNLRATACLCGDSLFTACCEKRKEKNNDVTMFESSSFSQISDKKFELKKLSMLKLILNSS